MPKIRLSNGTCYRYKTKPIFLGVKQINKEIALENLRDVKKVLERRRVAFQLTFGTLLGAIRENDFITHDEDIDLLVMDEDRLRFLDALPELKELGFEVARYDRGGLLSIYREEEYIDFYFFSKRSDGTRYCRGAIFPREMIERTKDYNFKGLDVKVPIEYLTYLRYVFGEDWQTPIVWNNYKISKLKRILLSIKTIVKEWLPYGLYVYLTRPAELRAVRKYEKRLEKYKEKYSFGFSNEGAVAD